MEQPSATDTDGRRRFDRLPDEIEAMIVKETDEGRRQFLIILNSINNSMIANTRILEKHLYAYDQHMREYNEHTRKDDEIRNKGFGAYRVLVWVVVAVQAMAGFLWSEVRSDGASIKASLLAEHEENRKIDTRLSLIEQLARSNSEKRLEK